jgi:signal transduction histidine kinase
MDEFSVVSNPGRAAPQDIVTTVRFGKCLPARNKALDGAGIGRIGTLLAQQPTGGPNRELESQNRELLHALDGLRSREAELERREQELARLNVELQETNRGVVALYAELDEKAVALRSADEMKSRFLSHVTHEFRTPVNSVLALTRLLLQRIDGQLSPEQEKQVSYIRDAAQQLADMVNDLLDLAKVEAGKTEIRMASIDVIQFLGAIRALMRPLVTQESVNLVFEDPVPGLMLQSDESKLGQILRNLVSNALKFTQQGEIRVSAQRSIDGASIHFAVRDSGIGIAKLDQERIFQEFAQIDHPIQKNLKGTGLGLPLSRRLATLLGGTLTVESELGQGSIFTVTLPVGDAVDARNAAEQAAAQRRYSDTILIVDDEVTARYLSRQLFRGSRYDVVEATGADAAERARFESPVLILLDLMMPDRSGFEVLNDLKSDEATQSIPVVIHTSKALTDSDYARLGGRHSAVLPKGTTGRLPALIRIREILRDSTLFAGEPDFKTD